MKRNKIAALAITSMLVLSGCSNSTSKIVDGQSALASVNGEYIFADDIYNNIISSASGAQTLYQVILQEIVKKECPATEDMKTEADVMINQIKQNYSGKEDTLKKQLKNMGYNDLDEYKDAYMTYLQYSDFMDQYIENHFDEIFDDYYNLTSPRIVSHILVKMADPDNPTEEEAAKLKEVQDLLALGKSFEETAKEYSDDGSAANGGSLGVCDKTTSFVETFKTKMMEMNEGEVSEPVKSEYGYHIIKVDSTNKDTIKEKLSASDSTLKDWSSDTFYDQYLEYIVFNSYNVQYGDETIEKAVTDYVKSALEQREKSRQG